MGYDRPPRELTSHLAAHLDSEGTDASFGWLALISIGPVSIMFLVPDLGPIMFL